MANASSQLLSPEAWRSLSAAHPRHPVVADANALFQDTLRRATDGFTTLTFLAEHGPILLLSAEHVRSRAEEHLPRMAADAGVDEELVMQTWRTVHEPLIRFVEIPASLCSTDPRVEAVRDPEDLPLAQLAVAVAPCLLLTRDHHLHDAQIGTERWVEALLVLASLIELELAFHGSARFALALGSLIARTLIEGTRLLFRSPLVVGLALGTGLLLLSDGGGRLDRSLRRASRTVKTAGGQILEAVTPHLERRMQAQASLAAMLVAPMPQAPPEAICARELAISRGALDAAVFLPALRRAGYEYELVALKQELAAHPAFAPATEGWALGKGE